MLNFMAANNQQYKWDCHVFFSMHGIYLDTWLKKMAYWGIKEDKVAIYALSDMLNVHSLVITKHRLWTTIDSSVQGTELQILHLCPVKLVFLGDNRFSILWHKIAPTQHVSTLQTGLLPVFPDAQPIVQVPAPPSLAELEMAETLLTMQDAPQTDSHQADLPANNTILELQEPTVMTVNHTTELILESPLVTTDNQNNVNLSDAMDKVVNHEDVSFTKPINWLKFRECMDLITGRVSELVELVNLTNLAALDQIKTPPGRVELVWIKFTPTVKLPTLQTTQDLIALGNYFTRSKTKPKQHRRGRQPRSASTDIDYNECTPSSDVDKRQKPKQTRNTLPADGPTASRVRPQTTSTGIPMVQLPTVEAEKTTDDTEGKPAPAPIPPTNTPETGNNVQKGKGSFATRSFTLRRHQKYRCKLSKEVLDSAHLSTVHHQQKHGILCCDECNKAFNNPTSLVRHKYQHRDLRFHCACGASFAFSSQLQTYSVVHCCHASQHCMYPNCNRSFKNKGDLKSHTSEHYGKLHECPDCDYKNSDIQNLELHRLKHSDINKYVCKCCRQGFKYDTQLRQHRNDPKKCQGTKKSTSP